jgi:hypothetical protein
MEKLEKFKQGNIQVDFVKEINNLTFDELGFLKNESYVLLVRNKKTNQKGNSSFKNLMVLDSLGQRKNYEVYGYQLPKLKTQKPIAYVAPKVEPIEEVVEEVIKPQTPLFNADAENDILEFEQFEEVPVKKTRTRKPKQ